MREGFMKFKKSTHLILKKLYSEETVYDRCKVLYYWDNTTYVVEYKPTSKGSMICYGQAIDKDKLEKNYKIDEQYYIDNN